MTDWEDVQVHGEPIEAEYYGTCAACLEKTEPGDMIVHSEVDEGWICEECAS